MTMHVVAFDIETLGAHECFPIVSIGMAHGRVDCEEGTVELLRKTRVNVAANWTCMDPRCFEQFWSKQPLKLIETLQHGALDSYEAANAVGRFIDESEFHAMGAIDFVSDMPAFDIGRLNAWMSHHLPTRHPIPHTRGGYRDIFDCSRSGMLWGMTGPEKNAMYRHINGRGVYHNHDPANDAHFILEQFAYAARRHVVATTRSSVPPPPPSSPVAASKKKTPSQPAPE